MFQNFESFAADVLKGRAPVIDLVVPYEGAALDKAYALYEAHGENAFLIKKNDDVGKIANGLMLCLQPDLCWRFKGERSIIDKWEDGEVVSSEQRVTDPFSHLTSLARLCVLHGDVGHAPFGLYGYISYDMVRYLVPMADVTIDPLNIPDARFVRPTVFIEWDKPANHVRLRSPFHGFSPTADDAQKVYERRVRDLSALIEMLSSPTSGTRERHKTPRSDGKITSNISFKYFETMYAVAHAKVRSGAIKQIGISQRFQADAQVSALSLFDALVRINPSPFIYASQCGPFEVVGASPRLMAAKVGDMATVRVVGGTKPRTPDSSNAAIEAALRDDNKEVSEHLMLLETGRQDIERVVDKDKVVASEKFNIKHFSHVAHFASTLSGPAQAGRTAVDVICAGFPAGTVVGVPKIDAIRAIEQLEVEKRSLYGGAMVYLSGADEGEAYTAIRCAVLKDGKMHVQAGAGIVPHSDVQQEYQETENKAKALFSAAGIEARHD